MRKRRILGSITILSTLPSLLILILFVFLYTPAITHWFILEKISVIIFCFLGGILLWKGNMWGYIFSALGWGLLVFVHSSILIAFYNDLDRLGLSSYLAKVWLSIVFIPLGSLIIFVLLRDILKKKHAAVTM